MQRMLELPQTLNLTHKIQCKAFPIGNPNNFPYEKEDIILQWQNIK